MPSPTALFAGSIAENYHRYLVPLIFDDYARELAERATVPAGGRVLEVACGTGVLTGYLRKSIPGSSRLVATDLNPAMVDAARANVGALEGIEFRAADGAALPFPDGSFDAVFCQFGVMFFPEKETGYREAARVLRPGGTFIFNVWDSLRENPIFDLVHDKVLRMFPEDPPQFLALPFGYNDVEEIIDGITKAGFTDVHIEVKPGESRAPSAREVALAVVAGSPLASQLAEMGVEDETLQAVEASLARTYGDGEVRAPMQSIAVVAELPR